MTNGPESAPRRSRRAADVPVDSPAGPRERESQQRARDREALRAYKALAETQDRRGNGRGAETDPPTRRQLRLQQQRAAEAGRPAAAGSGPAAAQDHGTAPAEPLRRERRRAPETAAPSGAVADTAEEARTAAARPAADAPAAPTRSTPSSRRSARQTAAPETTVNKAEEGTDQTADRRQDKPAETAPKPAETAPPKARLEATGPAGGADPNADVEGMSVEQALAARQALEGQARNHVAAMEALQADDPSAVDLELLAQQKALAERAKVLNRRTEAIRKLSQENEQRKPSSSDPTTAHNLAMVTPLEFVKVPGMEHPVMRAPQTSHVPIVTSATPQVDPAAPSRSMPAVPAAPANGPAQRPAPSRRTQVDAAEVRHSRILARADALVNPPLESEEAARPIGARSAFGLDPLDVMTAGLGRTRRLRFAVFGVAGLGTLALIVGVLMIVGGLGG